MKRIDSMDDIDNKFGIRSLIDFQSIVLAGLFLFITVSFSILLTGKTGKGFIVQDILFSISLALIITLFLAWIGSKIVRSNPHLFFTIGIIFLGSGIYALFQRFSGSYTIIFAIISAIVALGYLFERFSVSKKS